MAINTIIHIIHVILESVNYTYYIYIIRIVLTWALFGRLGWQTGP